MRPKAAVFLALLLTACTTTMNVKKVDSKSNEEGIRYFLPRPYLLVSAAADGTLTVTTEYFPDLDEQYAITTQSIVSKHKTSVELDEKGLLKSFGSDSNSTELAKASIEKAGELQKARMTAAQKAAEDAAEAAKKKKEALNTAEAALATAEAEVRDIEAEITLLREAIADASSASASVKEDLNKKLLDAKIRLARAQNKRDAAAAALAQLKTAAFDTPGAMNFPLTMLSAQAESSTAAAVPEKGPKAWGPVLFAIVDDGNSVKLVPVAMDENGAPQRAFRTQTIEEKSDDKAKAADVNPKLTMRQQIVVRGDTTFTVDSDTDFVSINESATRLRREGEQVAFIKSLRIVTDDPKRVRVTLDDDTPAGDYTLELVYKVKQGDKDVQKSTRVAFRVSR